MWLAPFVQRITLDAVLMTDRQFFLLAVVIYGVSMLYSVFLWRRHFRTHNQVNYFLLLAGLAFHTIALAKRGFTLERCPVNNLFEATAFFLWTVVAAYALIGTMSRLRFLGAFASPLVFAVGVFALMPSLDPAAGPEPQFSGGWISLHASLILLSYGSFGLGAVSAVMYLTQEHDIKLHKIQAIMSLLPSIERIEHTVRIFLIAGFLLLTVGLGIIPIAVEKPVGISFATDSKVLWSIVVWFAYSVLVICHWRFHLAGRRFAWGAVASFVFVLLTFWGTNLMSRLHN